MAFSKTLTKRTATVGRGSLGVKHLFLPFQPFNRYRSVQADSSEGKDQTLWAIKFWSEAIAVGNLNFVEKVKSELGSKAAHREVIEGGKKQMLGSDPRNLLNRSCK